MKIVLCVVLFVSASAAVVGNSQHAFLLSSSSAAVHGGNKLKKDAKAVETIGTKDDTKNVEDGGDDADDDDADDDDEEDIAEEKADSSTTKAKDAALKNQAKVKEAKVALGENREDQKRLQADLDHLQDANASSMEIDAIAQLVMKETESKALASMMGRMWKEMRMFEVPGYATHAEAEIASLEKAEAVLKANLAKVQARLDKKDPPKSPKKEKESKESAEGGIAKFETEAEDGAAVVWDEESKLPKPVQYILVALWILMLASMPVLIPLMDKKPATQTQKITGLTMMVVLFGGFYLFTNIILFQSVHFKTIRSLTPVECIYFMSQIITTVGYGDITPAKIRGQVFVALYVIGALFVIAMFVADMTAHVGKMAVEYRKNRITAALPSGRQRTESGFDKVCELIKPHKPSVLPLLTALGIFAALAACWVVFFSLHPDEKKTVFQAIYMSIITLSTVGFGYFTPLTEEGMIFGAFWMLFGAGALANAIGNFTDYTVKKSEYEQASSEHSEVGLLKRQLSGSDNVTELQFLKFCLLQTKLASSEELQNIGEAYQSLISDSPTRGVSLKAVEEILEHQDDTLLFQGGK